MYIYTFVGTCAGPLIYMVKAYNDIHALGKFREYMFEKYSAQLREAGWLITFDYPDGKVECYRMYKAAYENLGKVTRL